MKYAFTSFSCPNRDLRSMLAMAQEYGYYALEIRSGARHAHGIELGLDPKSAADIREAFSASGISLHCLSVSCHYSDPTTVQANVELTTAYIGLAKELEAPFLRVFCGIIPQGLPREAARERIVAALQQLASVASAAGITLVVETHDDWSSPSEMAAVMAAVDHPAVGVVWDVMHTLRGGGSSMEEAYLLLKPWLRHVHIHDGLLDLSKLTFMPIGHGEIDHVPVVRILMEEGYDGVLTGEWLDWEAPDIHLPRELATMRKYEQSLCVKIK
jgi:sugar phosphate isomerase/epimerase